MTTETTDDGRATAGGGTPHRVVIAGGGAAGLQLATRLGDTLDRRGRARVTLVERARTHLWKPLLHQVAAGSMDLGRHEVDYLAQAHGHHFHLRFGDMVGLDRERRKVEIGPTHDEDGREITGFRSIAYDTLVIAVGGRTNDFGTPGAKEHAVSLDAPEDAARFHRRLVNACIRAHAQKGPLGSHQLRVAIIGAGATGVELAAELHRTAREVVAHGLDRVNPEDVRISVIEAADRVLPGLPPRLSEATSRLLRDLKVDVLTDARVTAVKADGVDLADGRFVPAEMVVWAAGVRAPAFLQDIAGLETGRGNQLLVTPTLQTTRDPDVFAIGDCALCPWVGREGMFVPPRAQAAHQQATHMVGQIVRRLEGRPLTPYRYRDFGSLVSLGEYSTVGNLMGSLAGRGLFVEGLVARAMYRSLYKMHEVALHGRVRVALETAARMITRRTQPVVKLH